MIRVSNAIQTHVKGLNALFRFTIITHDNVLRSIPPFHEDTAITFFFEFSLGFAHTRSACRRIVRTVQTSLCFCCEVYTLRIQGHSNTQLPLAKKKKKIGQKVDFFQAKRILTLTVFAMKRRYYSPWAHVYTMDRTHTELDSPDFFQSFLEHPKIRSVITSTN